MDNQQLLTIIVVAIVANAVLITIALVSMRRSSKRDEQMEAALRQAEDAVPAIGMAATGFGTTTTDLSRTPEVGRPPFGEPPIDAATYDEDPSEERSQIPVDLLDLPVVLETPVDWRRAVDAEVVRLTRYHRAATVMLIELDGFERLADRLGDVAGARLLVSTARTLQAQSRGPDRCTQLGRGRFGVLLPETDEINAINFAERVRAECDRWLEAGEVALRLAIGWAVLDPAQGTAAALEEAERRLNTERRARSSSAA